VSISLFEKIGLFLATRLAMLMLSSSWSEDLEKKRSFVSRVIRVWMDISQYSRVIDIKSSIRQTQTRHLLIPRLALVITTDC
jgi:hypothetical protein